MPRHLSAVIRNRRGLTLLEILTTLFVAMAVLSLVITTYIAYQRVYRSQNDSLELTQNARIIVDRISREIRQTAEVATHLPELRDILVDPPPHEIEFQDGHDTASTHYIRYYLSGTDLNRQVAAYWFPPNDCDTPPDPSEWAYWDTLDIDGNSPQRCVLEDQTIAEYLADMEFWGSGLIRFSFELLKNEETLTTEGGVNGRNL